MQKLGCQARSGQILYLAAWMTVRVPMLEKALTRMLLRSPRSTAPSHTDTCEAQRRSLDRGKSTNA